MSDQYFDNVTLLLDCNGPNNSTVIVDRSKNNYQLACFNVAKISTSQSINGGSSLEGYYIKSVNPDSNLVFDWGAGDGTIDVGIYH